MTTLLMLYTLLRMMVLPPLVVLDPGHGGSNTGTSTLASGVFEKDLTLDTAMRIRRELIEKGMRVRMTRTTDTYLPLRARTLMSRGADCFVSIHFNSSKVHDRKGIEIFVPEQDMVAVGIKAHNYAYLLNFSVYDLSWSMARTMARTMGGARIAEARFDVLDGLDVPGVLVELGFVDHPEEGRQILDPAYRDRLARMVASAIQASCGRRAR